MTPGRRIAFRRVADAACSASEQIVARWLPGGKRLGPEWVARNPKRSDQRAGSFKVNLRNGRWADFASGDSGGDLIALAAFLFDLDQAEAAKRVAAMLGIDPHE